MSPLGTYASAAEIQASIAALRMLQPNLPSAGRPNQSRRHRPDHHGTLRPPIVAGSPDPSTNKVAEDTLASRRTPLRSLAFRLLRRTIRSSTRPRFPPSRSHNSPPTTRDKCNIRGTRSAGLPSVPGYPDPLTGGRFPELERPHPRDPVPSVRSRLALSA